MGIKFIHTADWQLGKPFARFDASLSARLRAERQDVIIRIAKAAEDEGCRHILVAGDIWDSTLPGRETLAQPIDIMAEYPDIQWWLLPGNHDSDNSDGLWNRVDAIKPSHVHILRDACPIEMDSDVWLLPAPWSRLHHGQDLTEWMDRADTPSETIRIGLAHGSIKDFGSGNTADESGDSGEIISPHRAKSARLDYLALGDWHGRVSVNSKTHYSGTPEPDRHKVGARGQVLCVEIDKHGAEPKIKDIPTARYDWPLLSAEFTLDGVDDLIQTISETLANGAAERDTLARIELSGETTLAEWSKFEAYTDTLAGRCAHLDVRGAASVHLKVISDDLDSLDAQGSVRAAAEQLRDQSIDTDLSQEEREIAAQALRTLFAYAATEDVL